MKSAFGFAILLASGLIVGYAYSDVSIRGVFLGNGAIPPITLLNDLCVDGESDRGWRAIWHIRNAFFPQGRDAEACWNRANGVVITCLRVNGDRNGLVGNDCRRIDESKFLDPNTIPRSAF